MLSSSTFNMPVVGEVHRRGVETASRGVVLSDGAEWIQGGLDLPCPQAVRIRDLAHAAERVALSGQCVAPDEPTWLAPPLHCLKHEGPTPLLAVLRQQVEQVEQVEQVAMRLAQPPPEVEEALADLGKRVAQLQSPAFQAAGWPIGSGTVASANKLVVEVRRKGAGMPWARLNVNALQVLRNAVCNDRWDETGAHSAAWLPRHPLPRCPMAVTPPPLSPEPLLPPPPPPPRAPHPWRRYGLPLSTKL